MVTYAPFTQDCERCGVPFTYTKFSDSPRRRFCDACQFNPPHRSPRLRTAWNTYSRAHRAVTRARGKAADHPCYSCGEPAHEWAFIHDEHRKLSGYYHAAPYGPPESYEAMCRKCHRAADRDRTRDGVNDGEVFMFADLLMSMWLDRPFDSRDGSRIVRPDLHRP